MSYSKINTLLVDKVYLLIANASLSVVVVVVGAAAFAVVKRGSG